MTQTSAPEQVDDSHLQRFAGLETELTHSTIHPQLAQLQTGSTEVSASSNNPSLAEVESTQSEEISVITTKKTPIWASPWAKLLLVGGVTLLTIVSVGLILNNSMNGANTKAPHSTMREANPTPLPTVEEKNGELQTKVALTTQVQELENLNKQAAKPKPATTKAKVIAKPSAHSIVIAKSLPLPTQSLVVTQPVSQPKVRSTTWTPATVPPVPPRTSVVSSVQPAATPDPMEQWLTAANIGSYGTVSIGNTSRAAGSNSTDNTVSDQYQATDTQTDSTADDGGSLASGGAGERKNGAMADESSYRSFTPPRAKPVQSLDNSKYQAVNYSLKNLIVGTKAKAKLQTPIAWSGELQNPNQNFLIQLSEPLKASDGSMAFNKGTFLVARVDAATDTGLLQMSAVSVLSTQNNQTIESPLPQGAILILGKSGKPLQAKAQRNNGDHNKVGAALLSGLSNVAGLSNQPSFQSVFSGNGYSTTTTNRDPNYLAGFGAGTAQEILRQVQDLRQQRQALSVEPIFILNQNASVQIFVNQSVRL